MVFEIEAKATFTASSIMDAFYKISKYYFTLYMGLPPEILIETGYIRVKPIEDNKSSE